MKSRTVLVIDDDRAILDAIRHVLEFEGLTVLTASNGEEALNILRGEIPSVILLDMMMPTMDGVQFRKLQTQDEKLARVPLIVLSADRAITLKALEINADSYLSKPVDIDKLIGEIRKYV